MNKKVYTERTKRLTSFLQKLMICLAVFVVFITSYAMVLPAIAINRQAAADDPAIVIEDETPTDGEQQETDAEAAYDPFVTEEEREEEFSQQNGSEMTEAENEGTSVNEKENEEKNDIITFFDDSTDITVYVEAPVEAFPEGTVMAVTPIEAEEVLAAVSNTLDPETAIRRVVAVDIAFFDKDGNEIEPACEIKVSLVSDMIKESREAQIVHIDDNGEGTLVEQSKEDSQNDEVIFESKEFSTYAVVIIETFFIDSEGDTYKVTVTYDENSNIPANALLDVHEITSEDEDYFAYCNGLKETITDEIRYLRLFDISIVDEDGNKIQPENEVGVRIALEDYEKNDGTTHNVAHFYEDGGIDLIDVDLNAEEDIATVEFETGTFSVFAVVDTETITTEYLTADGETYLISVTYGPEAEIPEGAVLSVTEIENETDAYEDYIDRTAENLEVGYSDIRYARFFDISILKDGEEIQPKAPVNVRIELAEGLGSEAKAIHFGDETKELKSEVTDTENENMESAIVFETDGFSVYAVVELDSISSLDGRSYGIMNTKDGSSPSGTAMMTGSSDSNTKLQGKALTVRLNTVDRVTKVYVAQNSNIAMWAFAETGTAGYFYVSTVTGSGSGATTKYLQISSTGISLVEDPSSEDCKIRITKNSSGKYKLSTANGALKINGTKFERTSADANDSSVWMDFAELSNLNDDDFQIYTATKVSVSGTVAGSPTADSTLLDDGTYMDYDVKNGDTVILYTRIWNETKYDYYVVDYDGMLIKAYEGGDTISWVGSKRDTTSWIFTEYTDSRTFTSGTFVVGEDESGNPITVTATPESPYTGRVPNYYYEFQNDYSGQYIAPKAKGETVIGSNTIGVNLNGRRYKEYYSSILAWDAAAYDYGTLAIKKTGNWSLVSRPMTQAISIYFAKVIEDVQEVSLSPVATIDHRSFGITLKMQDYGDETSSGDYRSNEMSRVLGNTKYNQWTGTRGLLEKYISGDYPAVTASGQTGHNLGELFDEATEVKHQFLMSTYNETGYFEFDSTQNFAHYIWQENDPWIGKTSPSGHVYELHDFVIYDQLATSTEKNKPTLMHGQFFPYNDLASDVYYDDDGNLVIVPKYGYSTEYKNTRDIHANELSTLDPRLGEPLYAITFEKKKTAPDYVDHFFGVEMSASFMQTASGLDAWGHDLIFEFSGDDDFWFYVDDVLVLDLGGIHSALDGSINFKTGQVIMNPGNPNQRYTDLRTLYKEAYLEKHPGASDEELNTFLDQYFKDGGTVFKDYSGHTLRMFYLERGAGASNIHMRFNLAPYKDGVVELEKQVTGSDNTLMKFPFQVWYADEDTSHVMKLAGQDGWPVTVTDTKTGDVLQMLDTYVVDGMTYHNVFMLAAGQTVSVKLPNESTEYYIKECLASKLTFEDPTVSPDDQASIRKDGSFDHERVGYPEWPDGIEGLVQSEDYFDYTTPTMSVRSRKKVVFDNHIKDSALKSLYVTKRLWRDEEKTQEITVGEDDTKFKYRVYIGEENGNYLVYNTGKYHIKDPDGYYCYHYYNEETGESGFRKFDASDSHGAYDYSNGVTDLSQLDKTVPDEEPYKSDLQRATFNASPGGAIDEIQAGFTVEIPELLEGTPYMVIERSDEIPTGYNLLGYTYTYDVAAGETVVDDGKGVIHGDLNKEELFVHNQHGFGLRMEKVWSDAEFMLRHDDVYYAIYECQLDSNLDPISYSSAPLTDSVRVLKDPYTSISWFFEDLEDDKSMNNYHIFEVELVIPEGGEITVDPETGIVSGYSQVIRKKEGETIQVGGMSSEQGYSADTIYTVGYNREKVSLSAIARKDIVSNSRPGIKLIKTDMSGDALQGAKFTLSNVGYEVKTFVSDASGLIAVAYLQPGKEYVLEEIATPEGYLSVIKDNKVTIRFEVDPVTEVATLYVNGEATDPEDGSYVIKQVTVPPTVTNMPTAIIKNKPYELKAVKIDSYSKKPIAEVHFALYKEVFEVGSDPPVPMPDYVPIEGYEDLVSGPDGVIKGITFADTEERNGLKAGTYYLRETTPSGYNPLGVDIRITISDTGSVTIEGAKRPGSGGGQWTISPIGSNVATLEFDDGNTCLITIKNKPNDPVRIKKMEEGTSKVLQGIKFDLYEMSQIENGQPKPGAQPIVSDVTGADGILLLGGMGGMEDNKSYYLFETETLPGYQLLGAPVIITTARNSSNQLIVKAALNGASLSCIKVKDSSKNDVWEITVYNSTGYELPASGGSGRTVYYITGACLIALSALLERKRH